MWRPPVIAAVIASVLAITALALPATADAGERFRIGPDGRCASPRRCWVYRPIGAAAIEVHELGPGVRVEFGGTTRRPANSGFDRIEPTLAALLPSMRGQMADIGAGRGSVVVPFSLHFADASEGYGEVVLNNASLTKLLDDELAADGPTRFAGDSADKPPERPRAMWVARAGTTPTLYGKAATPNEIDWVLRVTTETRPATCPGGREGAHVDTRAAVHGRRDGVLVGEKVLPSHRDPCRGGDAAADVRGAAAWAWNVLRLAPKKAAKEP